MNPIHALVLSLAGFAALFAAIWLMHRPLNVHACPAQGARRLHRLLEWTLTAWAVLLLFQVYGLLSSGRPADAPRLIRRQQEETGRPTAGAVQRNREAMRRFEKCINTNDLALGEELIAPTAAFATPVSPTPLYGAKGYLSVVDFMRKSFPDVQWTLQDMVADETTVAVQWLCTGTFTGEAPFAGLQPNSRKFSTTVMNFYAFDADGRIVGDVAATGIAGILQGIGALPSK